MGRRRSGEASSSSAPWDRPTRARLEGMPEQGELTAFARGPDRWAAASADESALMAAQADRVRDTFRRMSRDGEPLAAAAGDDIDDDFCEQVAAFTFVRHNLCMKWAGFEPSSSVSVIMGRPVQAMKVRLGLCFHSLPYPPPPPRFLR